MKSVVVRFLVALACVGGFARAAAQLPPDDCQALRSDPLAEARCAFGRGDYAQALLAAERALFFRRDDAEAAAIRSAALERLRHVAPAPVVPSGTITAGWIGMQLGHDSNATAGNDLSQVTVPLFRDRDVTEELAPLRQLASPFVGVNGGLRISVPLSAENRLLLGAAGDIRLYTEAPVPSSYLLEAHGEHRGKRFLGGIWASTDQRFLSQYYALNAQTIGLHAGMPVGRSYEVEVFSAESDKRYRALELGTHESKAGITLAHLSPVWRLTLFRGIERSMTDPNYFDREFTGIAAEARWIAGRGVVHVSGQRVRSAYLQYSQLFLAHRVDDFNEVQVGYEYAIARKWFLAPRLILQDNGSNIPVATFGRKVWLVELRRDYY